MIFTEFFLSFNLFQTYNYCRIKIKFDQKNATNTDFIIEETHLF